ncbi:hypothetical protein B0H11DRAFT_1904107 [Mycena galericulata]|nr:hypothetical protein B0H11DRAFT_1904107 [Mycena galericulata]
MFVVLYRYQCQWLPDSAAPASLGTPQSARDSGSATDAGPYDQASYLPDTAHTIIPSRSAPIKLVNSPAGERNEPGPLARIPSPYPDHIDSLHQHGSHSSQHGSRMTAAWPHARGEAQLRALAPAARVRGRRVRHVPAGDAHGRDAYAEVPGMNGLPKDMDDRDWAFLLAAEIVPLHRPEVYTFRRLLLLLKDVRGLGRLGVRLADVLSRAVRKVVKSLFVKQAADELRTLFGRLGFEEYSEFAVEESKSLRYHLKRSQDGCTVPVDTQRKQSRRLEFDRLLDVQTHGSYRMNALDVLEVAHVTARTKNRVLSNRMQTLDVAEVREPHDVAQSKIKARTRNRIGHCMCN